MRVRKEGREGRSFHGKPVLPGSRKGVAYGGIMEDGHLEE
jgi:hypothetical protein